jgi:DNA-binding MarR family transcriptional regulator
LGNAPANSLASVLERAGKLSEEQARIIQSRAQGASEKHLGHMLIQAGYVTQSDIIQSMRQHVLDIVYKLFTWAEGLFRFDANSLPPADRITIPIDLESVIMEGSRRVKEWERLQEELPDLNIALQFTDRPDDRLRNINLTVEEWRVVAYINPRNSVRQIARAHNLTDFQVRRIVYGLLQAGLVEIVPDSRPPQESKRPVQATATNAATATARPKQVEQQTPVVKRSIVTRLIERIRGL